ncbi:hypothetical protein AA0113_g6802 [Alternaria arborescens]|uniref:Uncharacterized protein n=1 Tax=Alternaria arborescens TaxID=156630 RepID=A0A4V1X514_9PLEO|nr:hypothetical protein AA0113_g6802 [Alternaria arborescens]
MAHSNSTFESAHDFQNLEDNNTVELNSPRVPLFVPSDPWVPCVQVSTGYGNYAPLRYSSGSSTAALPSSTQPCDPSQRYEHEFSLSLNPAAQKFTPGEQHGGLEGPRLTATAPSFVPVKSSKLNARAPSFLLSRLAIFDPPAGGLAERPRKNNLILPDARDDNITDSIEMMKCPQDGQVGRYTSETIINFNKGWHYNDPVLAAMYYILNAKKKKDFSVFAVKHEIRPVDDAPPLWPPHLNLFDIKRSPPTAEAVHIFEPDEEKWVIFGDWLETVSNTSPGWVGRTGYSLQFNWWKYSGSKRRFVDLPGEIRTPIYQYALGGELYPLSIRDSESSREVTMACQTARLTLGMGYNMWIFDDNILRMQMNKEHVPEARPFIYEPALELLLVSSWMREEVLHTGWELMHSCFFDSGIFHKAINARPGPAVNYEYLSKVELAFTNADWFDLLDVRVSRREPYIFVEASHSLGSSLNDLRNLRDLRLRFRGLDDGYEGSPWGIMLAPGDDRKYLHVCCQRTVVDWICTFAYPSLIDKCKQGKVKVTLTGCVNTDTQTKWEEIFAGKRDHDQDAAITSILGAPSTELWVPSVKLES